MTVLQILFVFSIVISAHGFYIKSSLPKLFRHQNTFLQSSVESAEILASESKLASLNASIRKLSDQITELSKVDKIWKVEVDSGDLECGSSSDIELKSNKTQWLEEKEKLQKEATSLALLIEEKKQTLEKNSFKIPVPAIITPTPTTETVSAVSSSSSAKSSFQSLTPSTNSGFDLGLLIAFPLMIGSLLFFLFFPIIGESLSANVAAQ